MLKMSPHGALQLSELVRFKDPAEGGASLALREGKGEALGFYLDRDRVHVGDLATMTEDVFAAWRAHPAFVLSKMNLEGNLSHYLQQLAMSAMAIDNATVTYLAGQRAASGGVGKRSGLVRAAEALLQPYRILRL